MPAGSRKGEFDSEGEDKPEQEWDSVAAIGARHTMLLLTKLGILHAFSLLFWLWVEMFENSIFSLVPHLE